MKRKSALAILTLATSLTLTACSFQFLTQNNQVPTVSETISIHVAQELSDLIDQTDFQNNSDLEQLQDELSDWAIDYADQSDYLDEFQTAKLIRVVDGDTIVVEIDQEEYKVRLIGVDTPESVASTEYLERTGKENTQAGINASDFTKTVLENCDVVYLQKDTSDTDRYGRLLRYVWLEVPTDDKDIKEISTKMLNGILVWDGYANVATYPPDTAHQADFEYLEDYRGWELE